MTGVQISMLAVAEEILKEKSRFSDSLLKSNLQKCIRRNRTDMALVTAKALMSQSPNQFYRRLPVIILEDVLLHPNYRSIVEIARVSGRVKFQPTKEQADLSLSTVAELAEIKVRDDFFKTNPDRDKQAVGKVPDEEMGLVDAIRYRASIGGMPWDREMLVEWASIWQYRFSTDWTVDKLTTLFPKIRIDYDSVETIKPEHILLEAVDGHCSPLIRILMKKPEIVSLIERIYPDDSLSVEDRLRDVLWNCRSGVSGKIQLTKERPIIFPIDDGETAIEGADMDKYEEIYSQIKDECDSIARWYISKQ